MTAKPTEDLDFSPFNAEDVLTAVCKVLRTSRAISFSYAGDIQSLIERIGHVFHAARCLMFVAGNNRDHVEIFEYCADGASLVAHKFAGVHGQNLALELICLEGDINTLEDTQKYAGLIDGGYLLPLKIRGDSVADGGQDRRAGLLYLKEGPGSRWNKLVLESFVIIADHLARLAQIEQLASALAELESTDKVTGFLYRRFATEAAQKELERVNHFRDPASLLLIDLDLGRRSPDVYGTILGEAVLKTVSSTIGAQSRKVDICGRLGLDLFLLFCPRMDDAEAVRLATQLVKRINESLMNLTHRSDVKIETGMFVPTTASIGIAHVSPGLAFEELFGAAQLALSAAQVNGGNMVKILKDDSDNES